MFTVTHTLPRSAADDTTWEMVWAPYAESLYQEVLAHIRPEDVVLEIGAGDMRLASRLAEIAQRVYAIEIQPLLIEYARETDCFLPNLIIFNEDALTFPFPTGISLAVLLMRHCTHFQHYADKLKAAGCKTLITNARWRTGLEVMNLQAPRQSFAQIPLGWYACWCGNTGFKPGPVEALTEETTHLVHEVIHCPNCSNL